MTVFTEHLDCEDVLKALFNDKFEAMGGKIEKVVPNCKVIIGSILGERYLFRYSEKLKEVCIESGVPEEIAKYV